MAVLVLVLVAPLSIAGKPGQASLGSGQRQS